MAAGQGSIEAAAILSNWYDREQNYQEAFKWYKRAAENGDYIAQYNIAGMYMNSRGVEENFFEAFKWYEKSAENGYSKAQSLATLCFNSPHFMRLPKTWVCYTLYV